MPSVRAGPACASDVRLNEQVKRNAERFPEDFMFQLTAEEAQLSRSQIATLNGGRGHNIKYLPHAFTEHGGIQAANVLNSPRAVAMGVYVVRAFVHLRELLSSFLRAESLFNLATEIERLDAEPGGPPAEGVVTPKFAG